MAYGQKLTDTDVLTIVRLREQGWTLQQIADHFPVTRENVRMILDGRTWNRVTGLPRPDGSIPRALPDARPDREPAGPPQTMWPARHCLASGCDIKSGEPHPDRCRCPHCEPILWLHYRKRADRQLRTARWVESWGPNYLGPEKLKQMRAWITVYGDLF